MEQKTRFYSYYFPYKKNYYPKGTEFIYDGECELNGEKVYIHNQKCTFIHCINGNIVCFQTGNNTYQADLFYCSNNVKQILSHMEPQPKQEFYFTDDMVIKTVWYVFLMLIATLFHERIGLWIFLTLVYVTSTFLKRK